MKSKLTVQDSDIQFLENGVRYILEATTLKEALTKLVAAAAMTVGSDSGSLYLLGESGMLEPYVLHNLPDDYVAGCKSVPLGAQCCGRAALHKIPWVVEDMWTDPLFEDCAEAARKSGMRAAFSVPILMADGTCAGSLACHFREQYRPSDYAIERQRLFAQLIAFAIARDRSEATTAQRKPAKGVDAAIRGQIASD